MKVILLIIIYYFNYIWYGLAAYIKELNSSIVNKSKLTIVGNNNYSRKNSNRRGGESGCVSPKEQNDQVSKLQRLKSFGEDIVDAKEKDYPEIKGGLTTRNLVSTYGAVVTNVTKDKLFVSPTKGD